MHTFIAFRDLALSPANPRDSLTIFAENSMSTSRNNWTFINSELLKSSSRFPGKAHRLPPDPGAGLLLCSTRDLLNNSDCSFIASGQDRMWGAGSVGGWRRIPWAVLSLDLRLDQDLFYERACPHLTGMALDDGEKEGFGSKLIAIWRRFRAVLSRLFQSRRNAFPCKLCKPCKQCKVLCKQWKLMAILGDYLPSVHDRSIPILIPSAAIKL